MFRPDLQVKKDTKKNDGGQGESISLTKVGTGAVEGDTKQGLCLGEVAFGEVEAGKYNLNLMMVDSKESDQVKVVKRESNQVKVVKKALDKVKVSKEELDKVEVVKEKLDKVEVVKEKLNQMKAGSKGEEICGPFKALCPIGSPRGPFCGFGSPLGLLFCLKDPFFSISG